MIDCGTSVLFCQDEKPAFFELGEASNQVLPRREGIKDARRFIAEK
jgi:hypothetical protein